MAVAGAGGSAYSLMARSVVGIRGGFQVDPSASRRQSSIYRDLHAGGDPKLSLMSTAGSAAEMVGRRLT